jgi:hypothetical protein
VTSFALPMYESCLLKIMTFCLLVQLSIDQHQDGTQHTAVLKNMAKNVFMILLGTLIIRQTVQGILMVSRLFRCFGAVEQQLRATEGRSLQIDNTF